MIIIRKRKNESKLVAIAKRVYLLFRQKINSKRDLTNAKQYAIINIAYNSAFKRKLWFVFIP